MNKKFVLEEEIYVSNKKFFGDNDEHVYNMKCYNGYAVGTACDEDEKVKTIKMTYPLRKNVVSSLDMSRYVLEYRGLYDLTKKDITYGDIMVAYGTIVKQ